MYIHSSINNHGVKKSDSSCYGFAREDAESAKSSVKVIEGRPVQLSFVTRKPPRKKKKKGGGEEGEAVKNPKEKRKKGGGEETGTNDDGVEKSREERRTQRGRHREEAHEVDNSNRLALVMNNKCMHAISKEITCTLIYCHPAPSVSDCYMDDCVSSM